MGEGVAWMGLEIVYVRTLKFDDVWHPLWINVRCDSLTRLCLEEFLLSNLRGRAMPAKVSGSPSRGFRVA